MITTQTLAIDVAAYPWHNSYDPGELARHADEILMDAHPGNVVQLHVGRFAPAPVVESFTWVRGDLIYNVIGPSQRVNREWEQMLHAADTTNAHRAEA
ncbi:hypothetical protein AB6813_15270 [bacterium RCC_150]